MPVAAIFGGTAFFFVYGAWSSSSCPLRRPAPSFAPPFPYRVTGAAAVAAGALLLPSGESFVMVAVGAVLFLVMLLLMPRTNAARDASLAGTATRDAEPAARRIGSPHRLSVFINFVRMLAVLVRPVG